MRVENRKLGSDQVLLRSDACSSSDVRITFHTASSFSSFSLLLYTRRLLLLCCSLSTTFILFFSSLHPGNNRGASKRMRLMMMTVMMLMIVIRVREGEGKWWSKSFTRLEVKQWLTGLTGSYFRWDEEKRRIPFRLHLKSRTVVSLNEWRFTEESLIFSLIPSSPLVIWPNVSLLTKILSTLSSLDTQT